jgi:signal transduction histidine kinase
VAGNGEAQATKNVLVLYPFQMLAPAQLEFHQGLQEAMQTRDHYWVDFAMEYLDLAHSAEGAYLDKLLGLLRSKYAIRRPDLIITYSDPSLRFLLKYRDELFPGVPVVFAAEFEKFLPSLPRQPHLPGVYVRPDIADTLQLALSLQPQTQKVVVVGGTSKLDRIFLSWVQEALAPFQSQVEITYLTDQAMEELQERLGHLPPHAVVYYVTIYRDGKGREFIPRASLSLVAQAAKAPVYALWDTVLGDGIVGGSLISSHEQGRVAGELVARILNGEKPEDLPQVLAPNRLIFDWRQLRRWGISEAKLPPGSVVRFREPTLWEKYRGWLIGGLALLGVQSLLIGALLINRAKRQRAEQGLVERLRFEEVLSNLSAAFVNLPPDKLAAKIDAWLAKIAEILRIDRITVLEFSEDKEHFLTIFSGIAPGIASFPEQIPTESLSWFSGIVSQGQRLAYSRLPDDLPAEAVQEKEYCRQAGLKSFISLPLQVGGVVLGVITFSSLQSYLNWSDYPRQRLNLVAEIFANALMHRRTQHTLEVHREELAHVGRLAVLNALTSNLAHEIIQPLTAISHNSRAAQRLLENSETDLPEVKEALEDIARGSERASGVIQQLRQHVKHPPTNFVRVDLNDLVRGIIPLVSQQARTNNISLRFELAADLPQASGNRIQLEQVLLNLVVNGMAAMEGLSSGPREIVLKTIRENADHLKVSVTDTGQGVKPGEEDLLFKPFFTTASGGLGLGLYISRAIIEAHHGKLWVAPNPDRGTAFHFTLPVAQEGAV